MIKLTNTNNKLELCKPISRFHPFNIDTMGVDADAVDNLLQDIPLLAAPTRAQLLLELAAYGPRMAIGDASLTTNTDVE